jgi:hypothetical protein
VVKIINSIDDAIPIDSKLSKKTSRAIYNSKEVSKLPSSKIPKQLYTTEELRNDISNIIFAESFRYKNCVVPERTIRRYINLLKESRIPGGINNAAWKKYCLLLIEKKLKMQLI